LRGLVYTNLGNFGPALADFDRAIRLKRRYALAYNNRGNVYNKLGKLNRAIDDYNQALEINPKYPEAYNNRGYAYMFQGQFQKAVQDFRRAITLKPDYLAPLKHLAVVCEVALKDRPCAIANYEAALRLETDPDERAAISASLHALRGQ